VPEPRLPVATRLWFAFVCFFRVLFDGAFAARAFAARRGPAALPPAEREPEPTAVQVFEPAKPIVPKPPELPDNAPALQLLALLQREGRLVDFLEQDVVGFADEEIGAAARVVHEGCRKALRAHATLVPVRDEEEGARVVLAAGFDARAIKLSGDVRGEPPHRGTLRHRGWRAAELVLPQPVDGYDPSIVAPAEVEL
jgi:hypothetical protein